MQEFNIRESGLDLNQLFAENRAAFVVRVPDGNVNASPLAWGKYCSLFDSVTYYVRQRRFALPMQDLPHRFFFSVSFLEPEKQDALRLLGDRGDRNVKDEISVAGLSTCYCDDVPYIAESELVLICKGSGSSIIEKEPSIKKYSWRYASGDLHAPYDFHVICVSEIVKALKK